MSCATPRSRGEINAETWDSEQSVRPAVIWHNAFETAREIFGRGRTGMGPGMGTASSARTFDDIRVQGATSLGLPNHPTGAVEYRLR